MQGEEYQKDKPCLLVNSAQTKPWSNTAGKRDTVCTFSPLPLKSPDADTQGR